MKANNNIVLLKRLSLIAVALFFIVKGINTMALRMGSWGTPELGITEAVSNWINGGRTSTGGSNLIQSSGDPTAQVQRDGGFVSLQGPALGWDKTFATSPGTIGTSAPSTTQNTQQNAPAQDTSTANKNPYNISGGNQNTDWYINEFGQKVPMGQETGPNLDQIKGEVGGAWDTYINSLDSQLGFLGEQKGAQEGMLGAQKNQMQNDLGLQKTQGLTALGGEREKTASAQEKNFRALDENIRNQMTAGNIFLGARGAGDSSAAGMYNYALGRQGNQVRGNLMGQTADINNEINKREENLNNVYNTEIKNTQEEYNSGINQIATWYADAQRQIAEAKGSAGRDKGLSLAQMSYEALNQAKQRAQELQNYAMQKQTALEQWAMNNSTNIKSMKANLGAVQGTYSGYAAPDLQRGQVYGAQPGQVTNTNTGVAFGYGNDLKDKNLTNMFGQ